MLEKVVEGKGDPHDWLLTATGPEDAPKVENRGDEGVSTNVKPGVKYTLDEEFKGVGNDNYTRGQWVCLPLENGRQRGGDRSRCFRSRTERRHTQDPLTGEGHQH